MRHFEDGSEAREARKRRVEVVKPREKAPAALESPEQPFDLVAKLAGSRSQSRSAFRFAFGGTTGVIPRPLTN